VKIQHNWKYQSGKWIPIEYPFPEPAHTDVEKSLKALGYVRSIELGANTSGFHAIVYSHYTSENVNCYRWIVSLSIGDDVESIFIANLPDLISFLKDCSNISTATLIAELDGAGLYTLVERLAKN